MVGFWFASGLASGQAFLTKGYTAEDGLPASEVSDVRRDSGGRLWLACRNGLVIHDGSRWRPVRMPDGSIVREVVRIHFDARDHVWLVKNPTAVLFGDAGNLSELPRPDSSRVPSPPLDFDVSVTGDEARVVLATQDGRLRLWDGTAWSEGPAADPSWGGSMALERYGQRLFLGTAAGLFELAPDLSAAREVATPPNVERGVCGLLLDETRGHGEERLWVQGPDWLGVLPTEGADRVELVRTGIPPLSERCQPIVQAPDGHGGLFYANEQGLNHIDGSTGRVTGIGRLSGLSSEGARGLHLDGEGLIWVAAPLGLTKLVGLEWASYDQRHGLLENETSALLELPDGRLLIGHNRGLDLWDDGSAISMPFEAEPGEAPALRRVLDLDLDHQGDVWIAGSSLGLGRLRTGQPIEWWSDGPSGPAQWMTAVLCDRTGRVWVGSDNGLIRFQTDRLVNAGGPTGCVIRGLAETPDGRLLMATNEGLWVGQGDSWKLALPSESGVSPNLSAVLVEADGETWAGGRAGLWRLEEGRLVRPAGFPVLDNAVYSITRDREGELWMGTDHGVLRWNGRKLVRHAAPDGLSGNETNRAAALVDRHGDFWIGTERGLSVHRKRFEVDRPVPSVEPLELEVGGERLDAAAPGVLGPRHGEVVFGAKTRTLVDEDRIAWRARLEGLNAGWREKSGGTQFEIRYATLPGGTYRLRVQARQGEGEWGPIVSSGAFQVLGPFWTRWWFFAASTIALSALGAATYHMVSQRRYALALETEVGRRSQLLTRAHGELARMESLRAQAAELERDLSRAELSNLRSQLHPHFLFNALHSLGGLIRDRDSEEALGALETLGRLLRAVIDRGDHAEVPLSEELELVEGYLELERLRLGERLEDRISVDSDLLGSPVPTMCLLPIVENAVRHGIAPKSEGGRLELDVRREGGRILIEAMDDGPGFPAEVLAGTRASVGLSNTRARIERLYGFEGRLVVQNRPEGGAVVRIHLPDRRPSGPSRNGRNTG